MKKLNDNAWERVLDVVAERHDIVDIFRELDMYINELKKDETVQYKLLLIPYTWKESLYLQFLWSLFVLEFGDYGVSVSSGWVNIDYRFEDFLLKYKIIYLRRTGLL